MRESNIKIIDSEERYLRAMQRIEVLQEIDYELMSERESKELSTLNKLTMQYEKSIFQEIEIDNKQLISFDYEIQNEGIN